MENLTINFCYSLADKEIKLANIDKLKLLLCLCTASAIVTIIVNIFDIKSILL